MDMDMDVAWCLTCSKRTQDPRSPYCSDACRQADTQPSSSSTTPIPLTSPVPPIMTSPRMAPVKSISPVRKQHAKRPSITPLAPLPPASEVGSPTSSSKPMPRDRRAFSFPAIQSPPPQPVMTKDRKPRQSSNVLPPFARKPSIIATSVNSPALQVDPLPITRPLATGTGSAKTTGANTPLFSDSVFCSTSESSDNEPEKPPVKLLTPIPRPARASNSTTTIHASTLPDDLRVSTLQSQLSSARSNAHLHLRTRETSHSPVAAMVASSASSRSREDIISWAKAVGMRPDGSSSEDEDQPRGRSSTRTETLAHLPPPSTEPLDENDEHESTGPGATPKGRIGSTLAGLGMSGIAPIVKALTSVTSASTTTSPRPNPSAPSTPGLGLQSVSVPAPAEISRVAVVATTSPGQDSHDAPPAQFFGGATPTLSTISFSEVVEPSIGDNLDPVDIVMDDQWAAWSGFARRPSMPFKPRHPSYSSAIPPPVLDRRQRNSLPLRPIITTATAIWNLSAYLRSFAPLSVRSVIAPQPPFAAVHLLDPALDSSTPSLARSPLQPAAPMPAVRADSPAQDTATLAQDLVCSLPMDINPPHNANGAEERRRPPWDSSRRSRSREKSIAPARSPSPTWNRSRSRSRSRSRGSISRSRSSSAGIQIAPVNPHGRKWSYDMTTPGDDSEQRRGRSRIGKALGSPKDRNLLGLTGEEEPGRGRERVRVEAPGWEERGSASRGRGRHRTIRAI